MGKSDAERRPGSARPPARGAEVKYFQIYAADWKRFTASIDQPAQQKPGLEKLFARPSVFRRT